MFDYRWVHPDYHELVMAQRLDELSVVLARDDDGTMRPGHRKRDTIRIEVTDKGTPRRFYIKRERQVQWKHVIRNAARGRGLSTPPRVEFEVLCRLAAGGVRCPKPVVCLQHLGSAPQGSLMLEPLPASQPLYTFLAGELRDQDQDVREAFFARLGRELARVHACDVHQPHLFANHVFVLNEAADESPDEFAPLAAEGIAAPSARAIAFLGFRRSLLSESLTLEKRAMDMAALLATMSRRLVFRHDREALVDAYLEAAGLEHQGMRLLAAVARHEDRLLTYRKVWEIRESDTVEHQTVRPLETVEMGSMWIDRQYRQRLEQQGLGRFQNMMATTTGKMLRALPDRENWRLELHGPHTEPRGAYLKKHHIKNLRTWLRAKVGAGPGETAGRVEAQNVARLLRSGIAAMRLIAYGERLHDDGRLESFVLTEELKGFTQLDHFLKERFPARDQQAICDRDPQLDRLLREVADVAAKFHRLGYNHRDLYCCHFFIRESQDGRYKVNLIDLQRVEHRRHFRLRWLVKDLAQLAYSAPRDRISCGRKMAFIKRYLGVKKLGPRDKRFIRLVLAKQRMMERNLGVPA